MLERAPSDCAARNPSLPLAVEDLSYTVDGQTLLGPLSFRLDGHGITMVLGYNGAGKSVLLRLLHGMLPLSGGSVSWHGEGLSKAMQQRQAMVFQKPVLLRRSVAANVDFALRLNGPANPARRDELLEQVGLAGIEDRAARRLSGGEQQRLALARAMAMEPEVLFLDEPTANLDPASVLLIEQIVSRLSRDGTKIVFVSHDLAQAKRLANDVLFLHKGRLAEHSSAETFFTDPESPAARSYLKGELLT